MAVISKPIVRQTHRSSAVREWAILGLFCWLTLIMLYPLSIYITRMVPEPTDPLLNVWRMQWNARAFLSGPAAVANLFDANIFYPFPLTLAYSEHFLMMSAQMLPFLILADSHMVGLNLAVLLTFILSGYGMYLLISAWTANRWAGLVAGVLFAFSPNRFGQLNHLELLVTEWMPLALLALHWTLTRPGRRYPLLFILFFNLQALSGFHYALNLTIACALLALVYSLSGRTRWRPGLWLAAALSVGVTLLLNWPVWRMYLRFSDVMGAVRTPGEVRVYSAALTDYFTAIPYNLLYGWTFGHWPAEGHQFQPLMPFGLTGLLLTLTALIFLLYVLRFTFYVSRFTFYAPRSSVSNYRPPTTLFLILLTLLALLFSFGLNENALGPGLAPLLKYSPYTWLYEHVPIFRGIRAPGRYGILVVIGLVGLAGWGAAWLLQPANRRRQGLTQATVGPSSFLPPTWLGRGGASTLAFGLIGLILLEAWSAPLAGPTFPAGHDIPPIYRWLSRETPAEAVALELPFEGASEFLYEYYSSYHWRRLANGGTGFTPPAYKELRQWFNRFPDPRSVDLIQQLGIDYVILHQDAYAPEDWQRLLADLPLYLPAIEQVEQVGNDLVLRIAQPLCRPEAGQVSVALNPAELDGLPAVAVRYDNGGPAAFVADVRQVSRLEFAGSSAKNFTEPLAAPAGEAQAVVVPVPAGAELRGAWLASLNRAVPAGGQAGDSEAEAVQSIDGPAQRLGLKFADGPRLAAYQISSASSACGALALALQWEGGQPNDRALVQLLDPFGRVVAEDEARPWDEDDSIDLRRLPLAGSLPGGRYSLRVYVRNGEGQERMPVTDEGVTIPTDQIPPLPVIIQPQLDMAAVDELQPVSATFGNGIILTGLDLAGAQLEPGDWLRFALVWQTDRPLDQDWTVFTQLLGPDGQVWGQRDNRPGGGWYGTSLWPPGRPVADHYAFQIRPDAPPGAYRLIVGWYHGETQERVPLAGGGDFVEVATVQVDRSGE